MEPILGQLILWAGNYAPAGFAFCDGSLMAIRQNTALFSILGNRYGGDGVTTFGLPDLRGRVAVHVGGTQSAAVGQQYGTETNTLTTDQMPAHNHVVTGTVGMGCNSGTADGSDSPQNAYYKQMPTAFYADSGNLEMGPSPVKVTVLPTGTGAPIPNTQPALGLTYCIALSGIYPQRP